MWGANHKEFVIKALKLNVALCPECKKPTKINLVFLVEQPTIYGFGTGSGHVKEVYMLCLGCGEKYQLGGHTLLEAINIFKEVTEGQRGIPNVGTIEKRAKKDIERESEK